MKQKIQSKEDEQRKRVYAFYKKHQDSGKIFTVRHFQAEGIHRSTIYRIIERAENESGHERAPGSGRKARKMPPKKVKALLSMFDNQHGVSLRQAGRKFNISFNYARSIIKNKSGIKCRKKMKIPLRSLVQKVLARQKCRRLYMKFHNYVWIIDDESYFTLSHSTINGNDNFWSSDVSTCPNNVKYATTAKYEDKVMVWVAISSKGASKLYFKPSGLNINQEVYLKECVKDRLIPFIKEYHKNDQYVFWPDKAKAHYAKSVTDHLRVKNVTFVEEDENPAALPETRSIENFWSYFKGLVYKNGWNAKNTEQLIGRIRYCFTKVDMTLVQALGASTSSRLDTVRRYDIIENRK